MRRLGSARRRIGIMGRRGRSIGLRRGINGPQVMDMTWLWCEGEVIYSGLGLAVCTYV